MKLTNKLSAKSKKVLSITGHIVGTISTVVLLFFVFSMMFFSPKEVSTLEVTQELKADDTEPPKDVVVKGKVKKITKNMIYGYIYTLDDDLGIANFSKLPYKVGDEVTFSIVGVEPILDGKAYLVNADFK